MREAGQQMEQKKNTYEEARAYLDQAAKKGIVLGLSVMEDLLSRLGNPEKGLRIVHIAGTNGKGSILTYIEQILSASGYKTGRYVSPALGAYENRFLIGGEPMEKEWVCDFVSQIRQAVDEMEQEKKPLPTVFELETAMAFLCFQRAKVAVVLLETGMGGRLDATNVIEKPLLSIIASVSMDHMGALGNTLSEIAGEKAGIIKEGRDTLLYPGNPQEVEQVIRKECEKKHSTLHLIDTVRIRNKKERADGSSFSYGRYQKLELNLPGSHQIYNAVVAVEAIEILKKWFCISEFQVEEGLRRTKWRGRLEKISDQPLIYLDGAHNIDAAEQLAHFLKEQFAGRRILGVMGVLADKEYEKIVARIFPMISRAATITPKNPRALDGEALRKTILPYCPDVTYLGAPDQAIKWIKEEAGPEDVGIIFGSLSFMDQL
jgi:dihydrofolate synthase/folylpolyglutamate synthase